MEGAAESLRGLGHPLKSIGRNYKKMKAVIMAGGKGTRIREVAADIPKPMIRVKGKPVLEYQLLNLKENGIRDIILVVGYLSDSIKAYFGDGSQLGLNIEYINEDEPLGTAGALFFLRGKIKEDFLLLMGDLITGVDFNRFMDFHIRGGKTATLFVHPNSHPYDSDIIVADKDGVVKEVLSKNGVRSSYYRNRVNAGIYAFSEKILELIPEKKKTDLDKELIRPLIEKGQVDAYSSGEYVKDMGTPDRYEAVISDIENGIISVRNLNNKQKCIFLDRDGTINELSGFVRRPEDLRVMEGVPEAIRRINSSEYLCIVVTNQPVIARGECSFETMDEINAKLETVLGEKGAYIDDLFLCPHHPDKGFEGEIPELKTDCECRKPKPGMLLKAAKKYNIDLLGSYMIGDMTQDILCGKNAGASTILVKTGKGGEDKKYDVIPDRVCRDLSEAVDIILKQKLK